MEFGPERIVRIVGINLASCDCWTRVLSKSAGCRTIAETIPPASPEEKCLRLLVRVRVLVAVEVAGPLELASRRDGDAGISFSFDWAVAVGEPTGLRQRWDRVQFKLNI